MKKDIWPEGRTLYLTDARVENHWTGDGFVKITAHSTFVVPTLYTREEAIAEIWKQRRSGITLKMA